MGPKYALVNSEKSLSLACVPLSPFFQLKVQDPVYCIGLQQLSHLRRTSEQLPEFFLQKQTVFINLHFFL